MPESLFYVLKETSTQLLSCDNFQNKIPQCCWSHRMFEESLAVCGRLVWLYDEIKLVNDKQIENKWLLLKTLRSSHRRCSVRNVLRSFAKLTGKKPLVDFFILFFFFLQKAPLSEAWGLQFYLKRDSGVGVFLWILRNNTFFYWTPVVAASKHYIQPLHLKIRWKS